jgi:hypothetical protein
MKNAPLAQKTAQSTTLTARPDVSAGPDGIALAPPAYGIDSVDRQSTQAALEPAQEHRPPLPGPIQMQAADRSAAEVRPENRTGLPDALKAGVERLSGMAMDDVRVHYNSAKPAQLQALAYTQGTDIHVGPRQERHLPHEAWHVVQQKQGRVTPTMQMKGIQINDDTTLEREASKMGYIASALGIHPANDLPPINMQKNTKKEEISRSYSVQTVQRFRRGVEFIERKIDPFNLDEPQTKEEVNFGKGLNAIGESNLNGVLVSDDYQAIRGKKIGLLLTDVVSKAKYGLKKESLEIIIDTPVKKKEKFNEYAVDRKYTDDCGKTARMIMTILQGKQADPSANTEMIDKTGKKPIHYSPWEIKLIAEDIAEQQGRNRSAKPKIGEAFVASPEEAPTNGANFHWGAVVGTTSTDYITYEAFVGTGVQNFELYSQTAKKDIFGDYALQTFYDIWNWIFSGKKGQVYVAKLLGEPDAPIG